MAMRPLCFSVAALFVVLCGFTDASTDREATRSRINSLVIPRQKQARAVSSREGESGSTSVSSSIPVHQSPGVVSKKRARPIETAPSSKKRRLEAQANSYPARQFLGHIIACRKRLEVLNAPKFQQYLETAIKSAKTMEKLCDELPEVFIIGKNESRLLRISLSNLFKCLETVESIVTKLNLCIQGVKQRVHYSKSESILKVIIQELYVFLLLEGNDDQVLTFASSSCYDNLCSADSPLQRSLLRVDGALECFEVFGYNEAMAKACAIPLVHVSGRGDSSELERMYYRRPSTSSDPDSQSVSLVGDDSPRLHASETAVSVSSSEDSSNASSESTSLPQPPNNSEDAPEQLQQFRQARPSDYMQYTDNSEGRSPTLAAPPLPRQGPSHPPQPSVPQQSSPILPGRHRFPQNHPFDFNASPQPQSQLQQGSRFPYTGLRDLPLREGFWDF